MHAQWTRFGLIFAVLAVVLVCPCRVYAQDKGDIKVTVRDSRNMPAERITVVIELSGVKLGASGQTEISWTEKDRKNTDSKGECQFKGLTDGVYRVSALRVGQAPVSSPTLEIKAPRRSLTVSLAMAAAAGGPTTPTQTPTGTGNRPGTSTTTANPAQTGSDRGRPGTTTQGQTATNVTRPTSPVQPPPAAPANPVDDFNAIRDTTGMSAPADNALLRMALSPGKDTVVDSLVRARVLTLRATRPNEVDEALRTFDQVRQQPPSGESVPAAIYYSGLALRIRSQFEGGATAKLTLQKARDQFSEVLQSYSQSSFAPSAQLARAATIVGLGTPGAGMPELQRMQARYPDSATTALRWNTVLYRLYLRPQSQEKFAAAPATLPADGKISKAGGMVVDAKDNLFIATDKDILQFLPNGRQQPTGLLSPDVRGVFLDRNGRQVMVRADGIQGTDKRIVQFDGGAKGDRLKRLDDIQCVVQTSSGDYLVVIRGTAGIYRYSPAGVFKGVFDDARSRPSKFEPEKMIISDTDEVAVIENDRSRGVTIFDRSGRRRSITSWDPTRDARTPAVAQASTAKRDTELDPVDIAYDAIGHLYVLDNASHAVIVFGPQGFATMRTIGGGTQLKTTSALAVDQTGGLYIFDKDVERVRIYR